MAWKYIIYLIASFLHRPFATRSVYENLHMQYVIINILTDWIVRCLNERERELAGGTTPLRLHSDYYIIWALVMYHICHAFIWTQNQNEFSVSYRRLFYIHHRQLFHQRIQMLYTIYTIHEIHVHSCPMRNSSLVVAREKPSHLYMEFLFDLFNKTRACHA